MMEEPKMKKGVLFISCDEAYEICDKSQYGDASLWELFKLNLRYTWCKIVRSYVKRNRKLTQTIKVSKVQSLNQTERSLLIEKFDQELKNNVQ